MGLSLVDRFLCTFFVLFAITSWVYEPYILLNVDFRAYENATTVDLIGASWAWYARNFDPIFLDTPTWLWLMCGIDCFVFGTLYLVFLYAFAKKREWVREPALCYSAMMLYSIIVYFGYEFIEERGRANLPWVVGVNSPYGIVALVLLLRVLRRPLWPQMKKTKAR